MNPIAWFESIMSRLDDLFASHDEIHRLLNAAREEKEHIMSALDKLTAAVADLEAKVASFTVPVAVDDTAEADALADRVSKIGTDLDAKTTSTTSTTDVDTTKKK